MLWEERHLLALIANNRNHNIFLPTWMIITPIIIIWNVYLLMEIEGAQQFAAIGNNLRIRDQMLGDWRSRFVIRIVRVLSMAKKFETREVEESQASFWLWTGRLGLEFTTGMFVSLLVNCTSIPNNLLTGCWLGLEFPTLGCLRWSHFQSTIPPQENLLTGNLVFPSGMFVLTLRHSLYLRRLLSNSPHSMTDSLAVWFTQLRLCCL